MEDVEQAGALVILGRGFAKWCPRCGQRRLFRRWFELPDRCPRCRLPFDQGDGFWLGSMAMNLGLTEAMFAAFMVASIVLTWPNPPWVLLTVIGVSLNAAFPLFFFPTPRRSFWRST